MKAVAKVFGPPEAGPQRPVDPTTLAGERPSCGADPPACVCSYGFELARASRAHRSGLRILCSHRRFRAICGHFWPSRDRGRPVPALGADQRSRTCEVAA